ncbi:MarR family winged helix-turn-helix transcriptional regulator [Desertivirga arenae]|uniref:MarR family winged helix-turn-helix transcriptional regulator n=1 Tax=Desertivirga arenae TaxID=2810309 RepID=UPI001A9772BE|nr:MarR family transcriptional regulator [Pedobacter sp. SYSU D00823]
MKKDLITLQAEDRVEDAPGFLLWQIEMCWQRVANQTLSNFDLTYTQFIVLKISDYLNGTNQIVYQHQVAKFSRIDRMMTSRILASLEKKNFIEREKLTGDARAKLVILTKKGKEILASSQEALTESENAFFKQGEENFVKFMQSILSNCGNL